MEGEPKPRDILLPYLTSKEFGARMTALGYFWEGKKADRPIVTPFENDATLASEVRQGRRLLVVLRRAEGGQPEGDGAERAQDRR